MLTATPQNISHTGTVSAITRNAIRVRLAENIHCEGCRAKAVCGVGETPKKEILVAHTGEAYQLHESVQVLLKKDLGLKAVFWAYLLPFVLVLLTLLVGSRFLEEWLAGTLALLALAPYYGALYLFRAFFSRAFRFTLAKTPAP